MSFDCHLTVTCWCSTVFDIVRSSDDSNFDNPSNHFLPSDHSDHLETQLQQVCDDVHSKKSGQLHTAHTTVTVLSPCWLTYAASSKYLQWPMCNIVQCVLRQKIHKNMLKDGTSSPFLRSLSGGRLCVGCSVSSSISWVTASLWGLGNRKLNIPQSPSAPSCPWEASIRPLEAIGERPRQVTGGMGHRPFG